MDFSDNSSGRDSLGARPAPFSGKHGEWRIWNNQFIAYVMQHEAMHVLLGTADVPPWNEVIAVGAPHGSAYDDDGNLVRGVMDKETALARSKVRKLNNTIFAQLMLCAKDMTFFSALEKAKTVALPYGDAALAWANLQKRYAPTTITSEIELRQELSASKLGKQTPDDWMAEIEHIRQRLMDCPEAVPVTDREVIVKVLTDLPTEYRTIVTIMEHQLVTGTLTIDNMTDHLRHEYKKVQKGLEIKIQNDKKDVAFVGGRYKGKCTNCGIQGHKAKDCRRGNNANNGYHTQNNSSRRPGRGRGGHDNDHGNGGRGGRRGQHESGQNNGPDSRISCNYCKKKGHKEAYCYKKQRDERDQANMAVPTQGNQNHSLNFDFSLVTIPVCGLIDQVHEAPTEPRDRPWSEYDLNSDQGLADFFDGFGIGELPGSSTEEEPPVDETLDLGLATAETQQTDIQGDPLNENTWICDSGASGHLSTSLKGMINVRQITRAVSMGNGQDVQLTHEGDLPFVSLARNGEERIATLKDVGISTSMHYNLFSLTKAMTDGWTVGSEPDTLNLFVAKNGNKFVFDRKLKTQTGFVCAVQLVPRPMGTLQNAVALGIQDPKILRMSVERFHAILGHAAEPTTRATAKRLGIELFGTLDKCEACTLAKIRAKPLLRAEWSVKDTKPGELLWFDTSSVQTPSTRGSNFWLLVVDDSTNRMWSFFLKTKCQTAHYMSGLIRALQGKHYLIKRLRCDNAGENIAFAQQAHREGLGVDFQYTSHNRTAKWSARFQHSTGAREP